MARMDADTAAVLEAIGPRLRRLRASRTLTLSEVAALSGLSVSALSRIETGHRQPTLDALIPLARAYGVSLDRLIAAPETGDPRVNLEPQRLSTGGVAVPLTQYPGRVQAFKHVLGPREPVLVSHRGHAWIHVLAGRLRLILGSQEHQLEPGEQVEFDSSTPHWFGPADQLAVEILHLFVPDGERPITRALPTPPA
ncbi:helix-turn-helix domain-containing protein [Microbacterium sp. LWO12-1.2]|uniref:helix-turn-helix domain-containing protein n=1 Tax=Microbacterium sp. LWO12-1.2 TaxID=3135261 RepID=UPI0034304FFA